MGHILLSILVVFRVFTSGFAQIAGPPPSKPVVKLDNATFTGVTLRGVSKFLGIPFAQPPVGDLRFRLPQPNKPYSGAQSAVAFGPSCPQQKITLPALDGLLADAADYVVNSIYNVIFPDDEDCLTINVYVPQFSSTPTPNLPVVVWFYGGGFADGGVTIYDGENIVSRSVALGTPIIYVSLNYRLAGFGFLGGQEVKDAGLGNLGLQDQRQALRWVQKYIHAFGGDPTKVTIWGESAGAVSVAFHMVANNGNTEGLFRGAFMESGSVLPMGDITHGQKYFDALIQQTGCSGSADKLGCLRVLPYPTLKAAIDQSPGLLEFQSLNLPWLPRADGVFITDTPQNLVQRGKVANVPFVNGDCDDEGTLFSLPVLNLTTDDQFKQYIKSQFFPGATDDDMNTLASLIPSDITQGSPYDTLIFNAISPQFKRFASFLGDGLFHAPRRFLFRELSGRQNSWSYLSKRLKLLPVFGAAHATDLLNVYGTGEMRDFLINFVVKLDPNPKFTLLPWPKYTTQSPKIMTFLDGLFPLSVGTDDFREAPINFLINLWLEHPL